MIHRPGRTPSGENDMIKFTSGELTLLGENREFTILPDGTGIFFLDSKVVLNGGVMDLSRAKNAPFRQAATNTERAS